MSHLAITIEAAKRGGKVLSHYYGNLSGYQEKSMPGDLVTIADKESEEVILSYLKEVTPHFSILSEESGLHTAKKNEYLWVLDPLDGTTNFTHRYPFFAVSIALLHNGAPLSAAVYNPFFDELFTAEQGKGAFLNGNPIHVSKTGTLQASLLATGFAYDRLTTWDNNYKEFCHLTSLSHGVRRAGSAALDLAYVAAGRLDGFWERGLKPWDMAAGILLIQEAGGTYSAYDGSPFDLYSGTIFSF